VALAMPKSFVVGSLVRQLWSFAGADERKNVSQLLIRPFVNYNRPGGWYLVSAPIVTANWSALRSANPTAAARIDMTGTLEGRS
jgi:hypothetical protein